MVALMSDKRKKDNKDEKKELMVPKFVCPGCGEKLWHERSHEFTGCSKKNESKTES